MLLAFDHVRTEKMMRANRVRCGDVDQPTQNLDSEAEEQTGGMLVLALDDPQYCPSFVDDFFATVANAEGSIRPYQQKY